MYVNILLITCLHGVGGQVQGDYQQKAKELLWSYGASSTASNMSKAEFKNMVNSFKLGHVHESEVKVGGETACERIDAITASLFCKDCGYVEAIYDKYASSGGYLKADELYKTFPFILIAMKQEQCAIRKQDSTHSKFSHKGPTTLQTWAYSMGMVFLVVIISNLGAFLSPVMGLKIFKYILHFLVAMAIGTQVGAGILVLLPESMALMHIHETEDTYLWKCTATFGGILFALLLQELLQITSYALQKRRKSEVPSISDLHVLTAGPVDTPGEISMVAWMVLLGDGIHKAVDGLSVAAAFTVSFTMGFTLSMSIICEEIPHELGDVSILIQSGMTLKQALFYNTMTALCGIPGAIIGIFLGAIPSATQWIFAFSAGIFIFVPLADMVPEMSKSIEKAMKFDHDAALMIMLQFLGLVLGILVIIGVSYVAKNMNLF